MFEKIGENKYTYSINDDDMKHIVNFMGFMGSFTKSRKQYSPVKNLTLEYLAIEHLVVDKFLSMHELSDPIIINVVGKYQMEIYIKYSKELNGITYNSKMV